MPAPQSASQAIVDSTISSVAYAGSDNATKVVSAPMTVSEYLPHDINFIKTSKDVLSLASSRTLPTCFRIVCFEAVDLVTFIIFD
jgi:hypothetical protein